MQLGGSLVGCNRLAGIFRTCYHLPCEFVLSFGMKVLVSFIDSYCMGHHRKSKGQLCFQGWSSACTLDAQPLMCSHIQCHPRQHSAAPACTTCRRVTQQHAHSTLALGCVQSEILNVFELCY